MNKKYYGWIAYQDSFGCHELSISEETISTIEEKYGSIVDNQGEIISVNFYQIKGGSN